MGERGADADRTPHLLRFRLLGGFGVEEDGRLLGPTAVGSRKARTLLKLLVARRGRILGTDILEDALWGDHPPADAAANLATLVSRLRSRLGAGVIEGTRAGYRLATGPGVTVDLDEAAALVVEAEAHLHDRPGLALVAAAAALDALGPGTALDGEPEAELAAEVGREVGGLLRRARAAVWRAAPATGDHRRALSVARAAVASDPLDEEAHRAVMRAHVGLGQPGAALAAYEELRTVLVDELGADPGPETQRLYLAVLRGEPAADERAPVILAPHPHGHGAEPLVGRTTELESLLEAWAVAASGTTTCVLVTGEAGIGKSALAAELAAHVRAGGGLAIDARCYEAERSLFLQPVLDVVRAGASRVAAERLRAAAQGWAGPLVSLVPDLARLLPPVEYLPAPGELERRRSFEAVTGLLSGLARQQPLLVVLDDLHVAGASSVELLHFLQRWEPAAPLMVVATLRSEEGDWVLELFGALARVLELGPLSEPDVATLAHRAGLAHLAAEVMTLTGGHTLFVVEALRALAETGAATVPLPASLQAVVAGRARRCGPEVDDLLRAAAVAGTGFDLEEVAELTGVPGEEVAGRAEVARRARLLVESGGRYQFANDLVRLALYETTPLPVRVLRHRRLAARLTAQPEAAASHAAAAGEWALARDQWVEAARRAAAAFANHDAEALLSRALDAAARVADPAAPVRFQRGRALLALGRYEAAAADFAAVRDMAANAGDPALEAAALEQLGWVAYHARDRRVTSLAEEAVHHPSAGPGARVLLGRVRNLAGDLAGAIGALGPVASPGAGVDPSVAAVAGSYLATALCHADRFDDAVKTADAASESCRRTGNLRAMLNARMFGAMARANLGDFAAALSVAETLRDEAERLEAPFYRPRALNVLAWIWRELGRLELARDLAAEALDACTGPHAGEMEREPAANALLALAESALLAGDPAAADLHLGRIDPMLDRGVAHAWRIQLRQVELASRVEPERAEELLGLARRWGSAKYESLALAHLGRRGEAAGVAAGTGSVWLMAAVAEGARAEQAVARVAASLPEPMRADFLARGVLAGRRYPARH